METKDIYWLAGIWEGEGYFGMHNIANRNARSCPMAALRMTDEDVIAKAAKLLGRKYNHYKRKDPRFKDVYDLKIGGKHAIGLALTLFSLLGQRRRARIKSIVQYWSKTPNRNNSKGRGGVGPVHKWNG